MLCSPDPDSVSDPLAWFLLSLAGNTTIFPLLLLYAMCSMGLSQAVLTTDLLPGLAPPCSRALFPCPCRILLFRSQSFHLLSCLLCWLLLWDTRSSNDFLRIQGMDLEGLCLHPCTLWLPLCLCSSPGSHMTCDLYLHRHSRSRLGSSCWCVLFAHTPSMLLLLFLMFCPCPCPSWPSMRTGFLGGSKFPTSFHPDVPGLGGLPGFLCCPWLLLRPCS